MPKPLTESVHCCVIIPVFDHEHAIDSVVQGVLVHGLHCILVDDGSGLICAARLDSLAEQFPDQISLIRLPFNQGKGAAVLAGFQAALQKNFTHALQIDADGQHRSADIPQFLDAAKRNPQAVIAGCPVFDSSVPRVRLYARYLTHVFVWINTLSFDIQDSMCGFRMYPLNEVQKLMARQKVGLRMNFDSDILVRLYWQNVVVINIPTAVTYPLDGVSHFRHWRDNVLITSMHTKLFFGMLIRLPLLIVRKLRKFNRL